MASTYSTPVCKACGLQCSRKNSQLLVVRRHGKRHIKENIQILLDGQAITPSSSLKILSLHLPANTKSDVSLQRLQHSINEIIHMIRRVATKKLGLKESDTFRLIQAFVLSRITYVIPLSSSREGGYRDALNND